MSRVIARYVSKKNEKFAGDTHGNEIESASDVPEEGAGPALHSPHLDKGGEEDGVLDTALYMEPLGGDVLADAVDPDAKELALSMDNIKTHIDEVGGEVSHILTSREGLPGAGEGGGGALRGPLHDGGDDQHSVPEAVGGIAQHAHLLDRGGGAPDEVRQVPPVEGVGAAAQHSAGWGGLALHGHPPDQGGGEALRGPQLDGGGGGLHSVPEAVRQVPPDGGGGRRDHLLDRGGGVSQVPPDGGAGAEDHHGAR